MKISAFNVTAGKYKACILNRPKDIISAQILLHDVYINELEWVWSPNNPAG